MTTDVPTGLPGVYFAKRASEAGAELPRLLNHLNSIETAYEIDREWFTDADALKPCPCFTIEIEGFEADGSCWRTCTHDGCCVHVRGDRVAAERLKVLLDAMDWYGDWTLIYE